MHVGIWKSLFRNSMRREKVGYVTYSELRDVRKISSWESAQSWHSNGRESRTEISRQELGAGQSKNLDRLSAEIACTLEPS